MRLTIPDDLADRYLPALPHNTLSVYRTDDQPAHTLDALLLRVLERAVPLAHQGGLALRAEEVDRISQALLLPDGCREVHRIVAAAEELADMKIGKFRLKLSAPVLRGLQNRADREGKPLSVYVQQIVDKLTEEVAQYA